ncbi:MAG: phosphotransferase enzyme family protein [Pseudobdellovibrionaceae bacterium]
MDRWAELAFGGPIAINPILQKLFASRLGSERSLEGKINRLVEKVERKKGPAVLVLNEQQIDYLKQHWNIQTEPLFHRRVANFVYFTQADDREVVLRLTEPSHRKSQEIESELHWMSYLTANGMRIAAPIRTFNQQLTIELPGEKNFFVALFEKAPGSLLSDEGTVSEEMVLTWGQYLGKMHRLTRAYVPPLEIQSRQQWEKDESLAIALRSLDRSDSLPYTRMHELLEWMRSLPQANECYGLIHSDLHRGNFFTDKGEITAFDFDDSCYQWFSYDFVAPVNSVHSNFYEGNRHPDKDRTIETFLKGYSRENQLDQIWIERIKLFDKLRAVLTYHWIKTFKKDGVFDATGLDWARKKAPQLLEVLREPLNLF